MNRLLRGSCAVSVRVFLPSKNVTCSLRNIKFMSSTVQKTQNEEIVGIIEVKNMRSIFNVIRK